MDVCSQDTKFTDPIIKLELEKNIMILNNELERLKSAKESLLNDIQQLSQKLTNMKKHAFEIEFANMDLHNSGKK